ncbi:hypothetical protein EVAR_23158_1 [Eumeta japonica]|uniref:Uncharacterized protein n=1 Tax=Eumeta variegata TaxID=151549 RepID=A0A4C1VBC1_EUMVA|nr:hypothetical protein EVAR_23158_1 [Eumeta japonica]
MHVCTHKNTSSAAGAEKNVGERLISINIPSNYVDNRVPTRCEYYQADFYYMLISTITPTCNVHNPRIIQTTSYDRLPLHVEYITFLALRDSRGRACSDHVLGIVENELHTIPDVFADGVRHVRI